MLDIAGAVKRFSMAITAVSLSACSVMDFHTLNSTSKDNYARGKLVVLSADQRVAISKNFGAFCAEPSPDALKVFTSQISAQLSNSAPGTESNKQLAATLGQVASNIGVRTQSIQLMRDAMYRVCEMYYGRAIDGPAVVSLHERYQDHMVAILAIEQLTGAVAPAQVVIGATGSASAESRLATSDELVTKKQEQVDTLAAEIIELEGTETTQDAALTAAKTETANKDAKLTKANDQKPDDNKNKEAIDQEIAAAQTEYDQAKAAETEAETALEVTKKKIESKRKQVEVKEEALAALKTEFQRKTRNLEADSKATTDFRDVTGGITHNAATISSVAKAVENIATAAIGKGKNQDSKHCFELAQSGLLADENQIHFQYCKRVWNIEDEENEEPKDVKNTQTNTPNPDR